MDAAAAPCSSCATRARAFRPGRSARVFDRFYRGAAAQACARTGSGLGLAIVKRIAERHDAQVTLGTGLDGRGLGVAVRFPATRTV